MNGSFEQCIERGIGVVIGDSTTPPPMMKFLMDERIDELPLRGKRLGTDLRSHTLLCNSEPLLDRWFAVAAAARSRTLTAADVANVFDRFSSSPDPGRVFVTSHAAGAPPSARDPAHDDALIALARDRGVVLVAGVALFELVEQVSLSAIFDGSGWPRRSRRARR